MFTKYTPIGLGLLLLFGSQMVHADTLEGYQNSTTRQQIERMDEQSRLNAKDTPNSPSTGIQGSALEGQLNRLRAEQEAEQEAKAATAAKNQAELEARWARESVRMREEAALTDTVRATTRARELQQIESRQVSMRAYINSLPANTPMTIANYDQLLDLAAPWSELMLPMIELAYRDYPQAFVVRYGFLKLSTCSGLRTVAVAVPNQQTIYDEERKPLEECYPQQLSAALPYLDYARQYADPLDAALACALMAGAHADLAAFDSRSGFDALIDVRPMRPRIATWLNKRSLPCEAVVPTGSPFHTGLIEPFVRDVDARASGYRWDRVTINSQFLWSMVARTSWVGVDIKDPQAVASLYSKVKAQYLALHENMFRLTR
ncbi:MAG: hypothetical protein Q7U57_05840 [Methylovulum sp.]|nr:hypothetical protein [Methylovulum sp.]